LSYTRVRIRSQLTVAGRNSDIVGRASGAVETLYGLAPDLPALDAPPPETPARLTTDF
jgi:hypothetical protein